MQQYPPVHLAPIHSSDFFIYTDLDKTNDNNNHKHDKNVTVIGNVYHGMGHEGVVFKDENDNYHALIIGGSNFYDRLFNYVLFQCYQFDQPTGKLTDLNEDTELNFHLLTTDGESTTKITNTILQWCDLNKEINEELMVALINEVKRKFNH